MTTQIYINGAAVADEYGVSTSLLANGTWTSAVLPSRNASGPLRRYAGYIVAPSFGGSLQHQVSVDGKTWDNLGSPTAITANTVTTFDQVIYAPFVRVVYTNGSGGTTVVRISISPRAI